MIQLRSVLVLPICVLALQLATPFAHAADNLLPEGNMENAGANGLPEGFKHPDPNWLKGLGCNVSIESEEGNNFLRFDVPTAEGLIASTAELPVPADAKQFHISWKVRADIKEVSANDDQSGRGVCMIATWYAEPQGADDRGYKHGVIDQTTVTTDGWVDKEVTLDVPEGKKFIMISIGTKGTAAKADFDDLVVEPIK